MPCVVCVPGALGALVGVDVPCVVCVLGALVGMGDYPPGLAGLDLEADSREHTQRRVLFCTMLESAMYSTPLVHTA